MLSPGNIGHPGAPGTDDARAGGAQTKIDATTSATPAFLTLAVSTTD
jgi:hypothetical protein